MSYSSYNVEIKYRGRIEEVRIVETALAHCMSPSVEDKKTMQGIVRVEQEPNKATTTYYTKNNVVKLAYEPDLDPDRFIVDWKLHNAALLKDQLIEGLKLSDWCYFDAQVKALHRSCLWGLMTKVGLNQVQAKRYAQKAVNIFKYDILIHRGCDLDKPIPESDRKQDEEIMRNEAMKSFHASHTKYY